MTLKHYWGCKECFESMGGKFPEGHVCTMTMGKCKYCGIDNLTLIPWVDFDWPKDRQTDLISKVVRD